MPKIIVTGEMKNYMGSHQAFDAVKKIAAKIRLDLEKEPNEQQKAAQ